MEGKEESSDPYDRLLDQMKKTQAHITIWGLLVASKPHREVFLKMLEESIVPWETNPQQLSNMVSAITSRQRLFFTDEDLSSLGRKHNAVLFITVITRGMEVPKVLVDNGS